MSSINLNELSIQELNKLVKKENEEVKKVEKEKEKAKLILAYKKLQKKKENLIQEKKEIKQKSKPKPKSKIKPKFKPKTKLKSKQKSKQEIKTFGEYFQECIKNKTIPAVHVVSFSVSSLSRVNELNKLAGLQCMGLHSSAGRALRR